MIHTLNPHDKKSGGTFAKSPKKSFSSDSAKTQINTPVKLQSDLQNATIYPGDYLIGDLNGVVCLPKGLAERAVALIASQVEADTRIARDLSMGRTFSEASREHRAFIRMPPKPSSPSPSASGASAA